MTSRSGFSTKLKVARFSQFFVQTFDRTLELMDLPDPVREFLFEAVEAQRELLDLLQMRRTGTGDQLLHSLLFHFDHLVELADRLCNGSNPCFVDDSDLMLP
jgi:hypothetical protein